MLKAVGKTGQLRGLARLLNVSPLAVFAAAYAGSAALQKGVGFVLFMWLGRVLSVREYAAFGLLLSLQTALAMLASAGTVETVVARLHKFSAGLARQELLNAANLIFTIVALGVAALAVVFYAVVVAPAAWSAGELISVTATGILTAFCYIKSGLVRLNEEHVTSLLLASMPPLAGFLTAFLAFLLHETVASFFGGMAIGMFCALIAFLVANRQLLEFPRGTENAKAMGHEMPTFILIAALGWVAGYGNTYIVDLFFTKMDVAQFTFAYTLSSVMQLISTSLNQVWNPRFFARAHTEPLVDLERQSKRYFLLHGVALGIFGAAMLIAVPLVTHIIGGNLTYYGQMQGKFFYLFVAYAFLLPWYHAQNYLLVHGRRRELMHVTIVSSAIGLTCLPIAIFVFGALGVYIGFLAQMIVKAAVSIAWARRYWPLHVPYEGALIASGFMGLALVCSRFISG